MDTKNDKKKFGNCVLYAVPKFIREGGHLIISWSPRNRNIPHVSWTGDFRTVKGFVPVNPKTGWLGILTAPFFLGFVKTETIKEFKEKQIKHVEK